MALCGAKTRGGQPCKAQAMPNGRCRMHGGKATGAPKGNQNARVHGIYGECLTEEELSEWSEVKLGEVDDELRLARLRLKRALKAEEASKGEPELDEIVDEPAVVGGVPLGGDGDGDADDGGPSMRVITKRFRRRDYFGAVDKLMARIESLERTRLELLKGAPPKGDKDAVPDAEYVLRPDENAPADPIL